MLTNYGASVPPTIQSPKNVVNIVRIAIVRHINHTFNIHIYDTTFRRDDEENFRLQ